MHLDIIDLVRLRDGEPMEPGRREHARACRACAAELASLRTRTALLRRLPDPPPPPGGLLRVRAALAQPARARPTRQHRMRAVTQVGAVAASLVAVLGAVSAASRWHAPGPDRAVTVPARSSDAAGRGAIVPAEILARSQQLESVLFALPATTPVLNVGRAETIRALEASLAGIDRELELIRYGAPEREPVTDLWGRRIDLMESLIQVRLVDVRGIDL